MQNFSLKGFEKLRTERVKNQQQRSTYVHPSLGERYFLWMLLKVVCGAKCYEGIRTMGGIIHRSFKNSCLERGSLIDDNECSEELTETSTWAFAR